MRKLLGFLMFFSVMFVSVLAWAQEQVPPETMEGMTKYVQPFLTAVAAGNWKVIGGIVLMVAMVAVRQFILPKAKIKADHLPFILAAMSGLAFAGMGMLSPEVTVLDALKNGFLTAGAASLIWDLAGEFLFKLVFGDKIVSPLPSEQTENITPEQAAKLP